MKSILGLALMLGAAPAQADSLMGAVGEIFLKGSIDGKHLFLVLGVERAFVKATPKIANWAVNEKDLVELGHDIYNKEHREDIVDYVKIGARGSAKMAPWIYKTPWKSLKKIPKSYKVNFEKAREAYYGEDNRIAGALKYAGWAAWANIQGAYYLIIQAPVSMIGSAALTIGAIPAMVAFKAGELVYDLGKIVVKYVAGAIAIALIDTYALVSSSAAAVFAMVAAGGVALFEGGKWLIVDMPRNLSHPVRVTRTTDYEYTLQEEVARAAVEHFSTVGGDADPIRVVTKSIAKYRSKLELYRTLANGQEKKAADVLVSIRESKVRISLLVTRGYFRAVAKAAEEGGVSKKEIKDLLRKEAETLLSGIELGDGDGLIEIGAVPTGEDEVAPAGDEAAPAAEEAA